MKQFRLLSGLFRSFPSPSFPWLKALASVSPLSFPGFPLESVMASPQQLWLAWSVPFVRHLSCFSTEVLSPQLDYWLNQAKRTSYYHFIYIFHTLLCLIDICLIFSSHSVIKKALWFEFYSLFWACLKTLYFGLKNLSISVSLSETEGQKVYLFAVILFLIVTVVLTVFNKTYGQFLISPTFGCLGISDVLYYLREMLIYHYSHPARGTNLLPLNSHVSQFCVLQRARKNRNKALLTVLHCFLFALS